MKKGSKVEKALVEIRQEVEEDLKNAEDSYKDASYSNMSSAKFYRGYADACKQFRVFLDRFERKV
jgi:hypothetical protein